MKSIILKVTAANFAKLELNDQVVDNERNSFGKRKIEWDDCFA